MNTIDDSTQWIVRIAHSQVTLARAGHAGLTLPLRQGGRHQLRVASHAMVEQAVVALESIPGVGIVPMQGGLLSHMTVAENLLLASSYRGHQDEFSTRHLSLQWDAALALCGLPPARAAALGHTRVVALDPGERWIAGLLCHMVLPPQLLVLDRVLTGLSRQAAQQRLFAEAAFHQLHPFRPVLWIDVDQALVPDATFFSQHPSMKDIA